ncbi:MAG: multiheme c-type cytochrome [Planctomycetota bacterium]|jgi:hypothetical protein
MRYFILVVILTLGFIFMTGCEKNKENNSDSNPESLNDDETPLLLDEEPLLLEDNPIESSAVPMADNSRCHVCHMNYINEDIAVVHAQADMGCAACHGQSDAHIDDESWASGGNGTPPEIMYRKEEINPFCSSCHEIVYEEGSHHEVLFATEEGKDKNCTFCHGDHLLVRRKLKWK